VDGRRAGQTKHRIVRAFRLKHFLWRVRRLFARTERDGSDVIGIHATDAEGNFLHILCGREAGIRLLQSRNRRAVAQGGAKRAGD